MACGPCRIKKIVKQAKENRSLKGAAHGCEQCKQGMADLERTHPRTARMVKPVHDYLTGKPKRRTIGEK